jgi:ring-1,2-phenylacetyl-CoA epoxidase subunit PaaC
MNQNKQEALFEFVLRLGDSSLILGHRISELCSRGPFLEEDIATSNMALDLIGQSRILLTYAGQIEGKGRSEDDLAYARNQDQFRNVLLAEYENIDFAYTITRQFFCSVFANLLQTELLKSKDETLAGYAGKAIKETNYHLRHSAEWMIRLGDGTEESRNRTQTAVNALWSFTGDLFASTEADALLVAEGIMPDLSSLKAKWLNQISDLLKRATLEVPDENAWQQKGSRKGVHTEHLSYILGELQFLPRAYPGAKW